MDELDQVRSTMRAVGSHMERIVCFVDEARRDLERVQRRFSERLKQIEAEVVRNEGNARRFGAAGWTIPTWAPSQTYQCC